MDGTRNCCTERSNPERQMPNVLSCFGSSLESTQVSIHTGITTETGKERGDPKQGSKYLKGGKWQDTGVGKMAEGFNWG